MDMKEMEALLYQARAEWREEKKRALEAEMLMRQLQKDVEDLKRQNSELQDRLTVAQNLVQAGNGQRMVAEELVARSRRALKTGNSPERVLAELATILLEKSA